MKNILFILLMLFALTPSFAQEKLSHADSLVLSRIGYIGPWLETFYINRNGVRDDDPDAPLWPVELLIDSFSEKSLNPKETFDFIKANIKLLYRRYGDELYVVSITNKEVIGIKVINGNPEIVNRITGEEGNYYFPSNYYIKKIPEKKRQSKKAG